MQTAEERKISADGPKYGEVFKRTYFDLKKHNIEYAKRETEELICFALDISRYELHLNTENRVQKRQMEKINEMVNRRIDKEPLQYIMKNQEFFGLSFYVDPRVLIPRPETEILVEQVILKCNIIKNPRLRILDIGTGSGNIIISIAKNVQGEFYAVDISKDALKVAVKNAGMHKVSGRIVFLQSDLFSSIESSEKFDFIVSNAPYISSMDYENLISEVKDREPKISLLGGEKGIEIIERIIADSVNYLSENGWLALEVGINQAEISADFMNKTNLFGKIEIFNDYLGIKRVVLARFKSNG